MHFLSIGIKADRETHPFAITGFISALEPQLNRAVAKRCPEKTLYPGGSFPVGRTVLQKDAGGQFAGSYIFI